jgi:radical SAM superfamily enzyme YgiQ (UPF0313 family)
MRIGLIAMSGIRAHDEELLRLGLTLPGFVERSKTIASLPSLGLLTLAGMTPDPHEVAYIEVPELNGLEGLPVDFDLVGISSYSAQIDEAYTLARRYRDAGIPVVLGGPHVSVLPEEALESCDAVVVGHGEPAWLEVLGDGEAQRLGGVYGSLDGPFDFEDAPRPAFDLLDIDHYNRLTVQTSRGCPHRCEFCAGSVLFCNRYTQKPMDKVVDEIDRILTIWRHPFIEFADDNSFVDRQYWHELLPRLCGKGLRWFAETDLSVSEDARLLELMRESGCVQVLIGLESPVAAGLHGLELRNDWKLKRWPQSKETIRRIQAHGISVNGCFVLGLDGHGPKIFQQVRAFVDESELYEVQITILTPFPGTPLYERLEREGRIIEARRWDKCTLFDVNFLPSHMGPEELARGFRQLAQQLYGEEATRRRRRTFKNKYLRGFKAHPEGRR